jgi:hypothetical protein
MSKQLPAAAVSKMFSPEYPAAAAMRPQLGSCPKMADLARLEPATLLATVRASASFAAPVTSISIRQVAPSPSQAMHLARPCTQRDK